MAGDDAVDESKLVLCCALCCANLSFLTSECFGCSGKVGLCCLNVEFCCKVRPLLAVNLMFRDHLQDLLTPNPFVERKRPEHPASPADAADPPANLTDAPAAISKLIAAAV
jgi:hypothetical protein